MVFAFPIALDAGLHRAHSASVARCASLSKVSGAKRVEIQSQGKSWLFPYR
jgi:hypothetical protein